VDILVNNAGGSDGFARIHELSDEAWGNALAWNLNSTFWATRRVLPYMLAKRWGRIISISSVEGKEVAAMAVLLASEAGGGITGSLLNVDGGSSSW